MISDICKRRGCIYFVEGNDRNYCAKRGHGLDYEDDSNLPCEDELDDYDRCDE